MFKAHPKTIAKRFMGLFATLFICGVGLGLGGLLIMSIWLASTIQFWIGLGLCFLAVFTIVWTALGFIFNFMDYQNA